MNSNNIIMDLRGIASWLKDSPDDTICTITAGQIRDIIAAFDKQIDKQQRQYNDLKAACWRLLCNVNLRHPEKDPNKWTCSDMERLAKMTNYEEKE